MGEWIVSTSAVILGVILIRKLLKKRISAGLRYGLWLIVLLRMVLPVDLGESWLSVQNLVSQAESRLGLDSVDYGRIQNEEQLYQELLTEYTENGYTVTDEINAAYPANNLNAGATDFSGTSDSKNENRVPVITYTELRAIAAEQANAGLRVGRLSKTLGVLWIAGMAVIGGCLLISNCFFAYRLRRGRKRLLVNSPVRVYVTWGTEMPCLLGLFRPVIYLTEAVVKNPEQFRHVLAHELTHYRHRDHIWAFCRSICLVIGWFNPLVWLAVKLSRQDSELACDEAVVRCLGSEEAAYYGRTLLALSCAAPETHTLFLNATSVSGGKQELKERVQALAARRRMSVIAVGAAVIGLILIGAVACTGGKGTAPTEGGNSLYNSEADEAGDGALTSEAGEPDGNPSGDGNGKDGSDLSGSEAGMDRASDPDEETEKERESAQAESSEQEEEEWIRTAWKEFFEDTELHEDYPAASAHIDVDYNGFVDVRPTYTSMFSYGADYDGDGMTDRVYQRCLPGGRIELYLFWGNGEILKLENNIEKTVGYLKLEAVDLTGDGKAELIFQEHFWGGDNWGTSYISIFTADDGAWKRMEFPFEGKIYIPYWDTKYSEADVPWAKCCVINFDITKTDDGSLRAVHPDCGTEIIFDVKDDNVGWVDDIFVNGDEIYSKITDGQFISTVYLEELGYYGLSASGEFGTHCSPYFIDWQIAYMEGEWRVTGFDIR